MSTHTQCKLRHGFAVAVSWLPTEFAVIGKRLILKHPVTKIESAGWEVVEVFADSTTDTESRVVASHAEAGYRSEKHGEKAAELYDYIIC